MIMIYNGDMAGVCLCMYVCKGFGEAVAGDESLGKIVIFRVT